MLHLFYVHDFLEEAALQKIQLCLDEFCRLKEAAKTLPPLIFPPTPTDIPESPPQLPFGLNESFLKHQNSVMPLMNQVDGIRTDESVVVRRARKQAIDQMIAYDNSLTGHVAACWERERGLRLQTSMESNASQAGGPSDVTLEGQSITISMVALVDRFVIEIDRKAGITRA